MVMRRAVKADVQTMTRFIFHNFIEFILVVNFGIISQHKAFRCRLHHFAGRKSYGNNAFAVYLLSDVFISSRSTTHRLSIFRLPLRHANTFAHSTAQMATAAVESLTNVTTTQNTKASSRQSLLGIHLFVCSLPYKKNNNSAFHFGFGRYDVWVWSCRRFYSNRKTEIKTELRMAFLCSLFTVFSIMLCLTKCAFAENKKKRRQKKMRTNHSINKWHTPRTTQTTFFTIFSHATSRMCFDKCLA